MQEFSVLRFEKCIEMQIINKLHEGQHVNFSSAFISCRYILEGMPFIFQDFFSIIAVF